MTTRKRTAQPPQPAYEPKPESIGNFLGELRKLVSEYRWLDISPHSQSDDKIPRTYTTIIRATDAYDFKKAFREHNDFVQFAKLHSTIDPDNAYAQYAQLSSYPSGLEGNTKGFTWEFESQLAHITPKGTSEKVSLRGVTLKLIKPEDEQSQWRRVELSIPASKSPTPAELCGKPLIPAKNVIDIGDLTLPPKKKNSSLRTSVENLIAMAHNAHLERYLDPTTVTYNLALPFPSSMKADLVTYLQDTRDIHDFTIKSRDKDNKSPILITSPKILRQAFGNMPALAHASSRIQASTAELTSPARKSSGWARGGEPND